MPRPADGPRLPTRPGPVGAGWRGQVFVDVGVALYDGPMAATTLHAHHAIQIVLGAWPGLRMRCGGSTVQACAFVIPPDEPHAVAGACARATVVYADPESPFGQRLLGSLCRRHGGGTAADWQRQARPLLDLRPGPIRSWDAAAALLRRLEELTTGPVGPVRPPPAPPSCLQRLLDTLPSKLDAPIRLNTLAAGLGVSAGHLAHLVRRHLGITFRRLVLWHRLRASAVALARGSNITEAAHAAGFSDAAHLSRAFRRMFGITPSSIARAATWHARS